MDAFSTLRLSDVCRIEHVFSGSPIWIEWPPNYLRDPICVGVTVANAVEVLSEFFFVRIKDSWESIPNPVRLCFLATDGREDKDLRSRCDLPLVVTFMSTPKKNF